MVTLDTTYPPFSWVQANVQPSKTLLAALGSQEWVKACHTLPGRTSLLRELDEGECSSVSSPLTLSEPALAEIVVSIN